MGRLKWLTASPGAQDSGHGNIHTTVGRHIPAWLVKDNCLIIAPDHQHALNWWPPVLRSADPNTADSGQSSHVAPASTIDRSLPAADPLATVDAPLSLRINLKNMAVIAGHTLDQLLFTAGRLNPNNQIENVLQLTLTDSTRNSLRILFRLLE
jgi:hypothetical protein